MLFKLFVIASNLISLTLASNSCLFCRALLLFESNVCYPRVGCFNITEDFRHITYRPINLLPEAPKVIQTKFLLFTRVNRNVSQNIEWRDTGSTIRRKWTNFDGRRHTKIIIHGFIDNKDIGQWLMRMKDELLRRDNFNVVLVDWSDGNGLPYSQAAANTRVVGTEIANLLNYLNRKNGLKYESCHIIGHSLGAHVAGYAAKSIAKTGSGGKIGRITGLDPAEPYFQYMPTTVRLDKSDARFVDIIHSDSKSILQMGLGMSQPIGHLDFYPNSGREQPGCTGSRFYSFITQGLLEGTRQFVACNHMRSVEYFIATINGGHGGCRWMSFACKNWDTFERGKCFDCGADGGKCANLGMDAILWTAFKNESLSRRFYLKTTSETPFCAFQYYVEVMLESMEKFDPQFGTIFLKIDNNSFTLNHNSQDLLQGNTYSFVTALKNQILSIDAIEFRWRSSSNIFKPIAWSQKLFAVNSDAPTNEVTHELFVKQVSVKSVDEELHTNLWVFCEKPPYIGIKSNSLFRFTQVC